ncbi:MAG TPA: hypothetical protein VMR62_28300 [Bryobacteraceae bacterium]|nr:hypothetical protein [Bryobacteraceae bacterium]
MKSYLEVAARVLLRIGAALLGTEAAEPTHAELDRLQALADEVRDHYNQAPAIAGMLKDAGRQMDAVTGQPGTAPALASTVSWHAGHPAREPELAIRRVPSRHPAGCLCGHRPETGLRLYIQPRRAAWQGHLPGSS